MRPGWPHILLISTALHATALLGFFAFSLPSSVPRPAPTEAPDLSTLSLQLRSEEVTHAIIASTQPKTQSKAVAQGAPVLKAKVADAPTPEQPDSFALKDRDRTPIRVLEDPVLSPSPAPSVNAHDGVVFILDISGSMYEPYAGSTRLVMARRLLDQHLVELKDGTPFAIVVYGETARRSGPLVPANAATRSAAIAYADQEFNCGGGTDLPVGLTLAEELQANSLLLITDGDLNMRRAALMPEVSRILGSGGNGSSLSILAIAPRANTAARSLLQELAKEEGGTYQADVDGGNLTAIVAKKDIADTP